MSAAARRLAHLRLHVLMIALLALALLVVGAAGSATAATSYKGKTKQKLPISFRTTATSAVGFKTTVRSLCIAAATSRSVLEFYPVLLQKPTKLTNGRFTINFKGKSSTFITVKGKVNGASASGSIDVRYTKSIGMTSTGLLEIAACSAKTTWTAKS